MLLKKCLIIALFKQKSESREVADIKMSLYKYSWEEFAADM